MNSIAECTESGQRSVHSEAEKKAFYAGGEKKKRGLDDSGFSTAFGGEMQDCMDINTKMWKKRVFVIFL